MPSSSKKKILIIGSLPPPHHGCNVYVQQLLSSDLRRRFKIIHLDTSDRRSLDNISNWDLINVALAIKHMLILIFLCVRHRPDLAHLSISQNAVGYLRDGLFLFLLKICTLAKTRIVIHLHGSYFREFYRGANPLLRRFVDGSLRCVSRAVVLGERLKPIFDRWLPPSRISVVPNGTPLRPSLNGKFERPSRREKRVIYLGNLYKFKGVLDIIQAAGLVLRSHPEVKFRFAGSWGQDPIFKIGAAQFRAECEAHIAQTGRTDRFEFLGELRGQDVVDYLLDGDVFVFPSHVEGMPLVILEAMAAGNPVISTKDVGAIPEVVRDGETGILVEKQNPPALAAALLELIENPQKRLAMGAAGRRRFEAHYTSEKSLAQLIRIFESTLTGVEHQQAADSST
jgi:glycosyltransferase involved in cell wall biosynthesis